MFAKSESRMMLTAPGGGAVFTVTVACAVTDPALFVAVRVYVVVCAGETPSEVPVTVPMPAMEREVAPLTVQASVELAPAVIPAGLAVKEEMLGGCVLRTVTEMAGDVAVLFDVSLAVAASVCVPSATAVVFQEKTNGADVMGLPVSVPLIRNWTLATPTLSEAAAVTATVPETVEFGAGAVIATEGGVVSGAITVTVVWAVTAPAAFVAVRV